MSPGPANFDRLSTAYRALEYIAFGRDLERARECHIDRLRDCRNILILGEGDGRFLAQLVPVASHAQIHCVDASAAMITRARDRLAGTAALSRVTFEQADARKVRLATGAYDAVVTLFFLDCFDAAQCEAVIANVAQSLQPGARWLYADFALPPSGPARWRARVWLAVLYTFFRWQTGLQTRELPPSENLIHAAGFSISSRKTLQNGLLTSALFLRGFS